MRRRALVLLVSGLAACAPFATGRPDLLDFLADGTTRRDEVLLRLGQPASTLEGDRVLMYRVGQDRDGYFLDPGQVHPAPWYRPCCLVLIFGADGILSRHSLVTLTDGPLPGSLF